MTIIKVMAKTNQRNNSIEFDKEKDSYIVCVKAPPKNNKANLEIIKTLSKHFGKKARIITGATSKKKLISLI